MSEIQNLENDAENFINNAEKEVEVVFTDIVTGTSYAEQIIAKILTDAIPVADTVVSIVDPQALIYVNVFSQVLGAIKAIAGNVNSLTGQMNAIVELIKPIEQGADISVQEVEKLVTNVETTYNATVASIENITAALKPIVQKAIVEVSKNA